MDHSENLLGIGCRPGTRPLLTLMKAKARAKVLPAAEPFRSFPWRQRVSIPVSVLLVRQHVRRLYR